MLIDSLKSQLAEDGRVIVEMSLQRNEAKAMEEIWDNDKDDLMCQISILTDERDAAQRSEEELYEGLGEKAQDLEILQESYVDMTDRCNDANDEISDLREQLQVLREALAERNAVFPANNGFLDLIEESNPVLGTGQSGAGSASRVDSGDTFEPQKDANKDKDKDRDRDRDKGRDRDRQVIEKQREKGKEIMKDVVKDKAKDIDRDRDSHSNRVLRPSNDELSETQPRNVLCAQAIVWSSSSSARRASKDSDSGGQTDSAFDSDNRWIEVEVEAGAETEAETEAEVTPPRRVRGLPRTFSVEKTSTLLNEDTVQVKSALNDTSGYLAALETGS